MVSYLSAAAFLAAASSSSSSGTAFGGGVASAFQVPIPSPSSYPRRSPRVLLSMVATDPTTTDPTTAAAAAAASSARSNKNAFTAPPPKYPVVRGTTVDSRDIVSSQPLTAVRVNHVLFASEEMAVEYLAKLRNAQVVGFDELARLVSNCDLTREKGGEVGWVSIGSGGGSGGGIGSKKGEGEEKTEEDENEHLDGLLPREAREEVLGMSTKPGDVVMVSSPRGYHLVQIADVMVDVRRMAQLKERRQRKKKKSGGESPPSSSPDESPDGAPAKKKKTGPGDGGAKLRGILGGALGPDGDGDVDAEGGRAVGGVKTDLTYKVETMGCQMNSADSERIEGQLRSLGLRPLLPEEEGRGPKGNRKNPDLVVLNTCSIREKAEEKVYSYIGPHAKRKREGEDVTIVVAGCVAQQEGEALLRRAPEVDLVMGPQYANRIADLLEDVSNGNQVVATEAAHIMEDSTKPRRGSEVAAWVNVIYGCNERCTYCVVPTTRGVEQSRPVESIMQEVEELVGRGYREVTLLGQNIDAYGRDMIPKRKFSDLLRTVGSVPGLDRLRFVTSHPRYMSLGVVDAVAETPSACENFHVPFQSGSNEVLAAMGRGHTREKYLQIIDRIRTRLPDASITADVIVGFPGETEEQFQETLSLMEEVVFDSVNTAAYSPRPNTPAAEWDNQLSEEVKQDRLRRINELNLKHAGQRRSRMMGRTVEVLVEERNVKKPTQVMGRTTHGFIVYFDGDIDELRGKLVNVEIDMCQTYYLGGKLIEVVKK